MLERPYFFNLYFMRQEPGHLVKGGFRSKKDVDFYTIHCYNYTMVTNCVLFRQVVKDEMDFHINTNHPLQNKIVEPIINGGVRNEYSSKTN
jgi:hypothetical protein